MKEIRKCEHHSENGNFRRNDSFDLKTGKIDQLRKNKLSEALIMRNYWKDGYDIQCLFFRHVAPVKQMLLLRITQVLYIPCDLLLS